MLGVPVITAAHVVCILLIEAQDLKILFIQPTDKICVLYHQQELCRRVLEKFGQTLLIAPRKGPAFIIGKLCVVGWV